LANTELSKPDFSLTLVAGRKSGLHLCANQVVMKASKVELLACMQYYLGQE